MQCDRAAEPGRVRCSVEAQVDGERRIAWADVELLQLPELATALKGRIGPTDATTHEPSAYTWAFALVARRAGQGEARARVRAVVCEGAADSPVCTPVSLEVRAVVAVGS